MGCQKSLGCCTGVIPCPIMDEKQGLRGLLHDLLQEPLVTFRIKPTLDTLIKQPAREIFNGAKHFVAFALATGFDFGLLAAPRPRIAQRAPLGKTGLILKENEAFLSLGGAQNPGPVLLEPVLAPCGVEMIRHKAGLLKRKPQVVQQRTHILAVVEHAKLPPDQHPDEHGGPTGRLTAHDKWTCLDQLHQALLLPGGQLRAATATMAVDQAVETPQQQGLLPVIETGGAEAPTLTQHRHGHVVHQEVDQDRGPPHQTHIIAPIGMLQTAVEVFDGGATALYPDAHGCILLLSYSD